MVKVFLDVNRLISLFEGREGGGDDDFMNFQVCISPLSIHIWFYLYKKKMPQSLLAKLVGKFECINFNKQIMEKAMEGPTKDFEDNVQLHSGVEGECDYFLTADKDLLKMGYFGKMKIVSKLKK